ncbi:hypothetical protein [Fundidesulfovibrio agrisoli]|uniref:hypothetical protein n=1 Tax=Fundidesulfovibrio agrisoli TaxID=2922717 RepID=UPI001FACA0BB|nr:hypothetical protein [Fundidesulfovibrio agrisoli]
MARRVSDKPEGAVRIRRPGRIREFLEQTGQAAGLAEYGLSGPDLGLTPTGGESKKIVAVSTEAEFSPALIRQALGVAGRLGTEVVGLSVGRPDADKNDEQAAKRRGLFEMRAEKSAGDFAREARQAGVVFRHVLRFGRASDVVEQECGRLRRVEFVLAVKEQRGRDGFHVSMPLFEVIG